MHPTHDPSLRSWVESANLPGSDFPIQNLPFGVFRPRGTGAPGRIGVAIGDYVIDVAGCYEETLLGGEAADAGRACLSPSLNLLMELGPAHWAALRTRLSALLADRSAEAIQRERVARLLARQADVEMLRPAQIGDYTDFYASVYHATNVGRLFRPDQPLLPNYKWVPIAYHGRSSSIVVSGTNITRPHGQVKPAGADVPRLAASARLDYELEVGWFIGPGNALGHPVSIDAAESNVFGLCLVNDWSARDIQQWEYQPLGPFLAKNFATTISPWVVTLDALDPFRVPAFARPDGDPQPLPHLDSPANRARGGIDLTLEVGLRTAAMRERDEPVAWITRGTFARMYWTIAQMVTHHAVNGCNLRPGDLIASGTVSGPDHGSQGCLLELTRGGAEALRLPDGTERRFLEDGDEVVMRGFCEREGAVRIGLGECRGAILPGRHVGL
ncbi:MAG: fumarylacetoacetase [Bacteroidales bacterium]